MNGPLAIILITEKKQRNKNQQITVEYLTEKHQKYK